MALFVSTQESDVHLGQPRSLRGKKKEKDKKFQIIPVKIFVPKEHPRALLADPIVNALDDTLQYLDHAQVQGQLPKIHQGPYKMTIYLPGNSAAERRHNLSKKPELLLQGVTMQHVQIVASDAHYLITTKLKVPWKSIEQSGQVAVLCETSVIAYFEAEQTELEIPEAEEKAEKTPKQGGRRGMIKD